MGSNGYYMHVKYTGMAEVDVSMTEFGSTTDIATETIAGTEQDDEDKDLQTSLEVSHTKQQEHMMNECRI